MKISISLTNYSWSDDPRQLASHLSDIAAAADAAGVDTLWVADYLLQAAPSTDIGEPMLEAYTTLGYLAALTRRLRLGSMVTWSGIRPAALLIKIVTTLDVLSEGRAWFGIGAGYNRREAEMMGLPFPATRERFDILEETLDLATKMWSNDSAPFESRHLQLEEPISSPSPISQPGPRILIGGIGEKRTLPLVARYADACNLFDIPDEGKTIRQKLDLLDSLCHDLGRAPDEIETTVSARLEPSESATDLTRRCQYFCELGIDHVVLITDGPWTIPLVHTVESALSEVESLMA